jgi:hypothetical protein
VSRLEVEAFSFLLFWNLQFVSHAEARRAELPPIDPAMEGVAYFSGFPAAHSGAIKPSLCSRRYRNFGVAKRSKSLDFLILVCSSSSSPSSSSSDANHRDDEAFFFDDVRRKRQDSAIFSSLALSYNRIFLRSSSSSKRFCKTQLCVFRSSRTDEIESSRGRFLVRGSSLGGGGQGSEFDQATASTSSVSELITPEQGLRQTEWREFVEEDWKQRELEDFGDSALALKSNPQEENYLNQREWQEFEDAVERQDLGRALRALEVLNRFESDTAESSTTFVQQNGTIDVLDKKDIIGEPFFLQQVLQEEETKPSPQFRSVLIPRRECLKMLDTCQSALDLQLVGQAYNWLKLRGLLPSFGKFRAQGKFFHKNPIIAVFEPLKGLGFRVPVLFAIGQYIDGLSSTNLNCMDPKFTQSLFRVI